MDRKQLSRVEIKDADRGEVTAVFSTLNKIDKDGDVTLKGAFEDGAPCVISAYGHQSWKGKLPVGKGRIRETATEGIFEGKFFLDTIDGLDTFRVVKALSEDDGPGQEWSYGLVDMVTERGDFEGQKVRFIKSVRVPEVSPVLLGAGVDTRTLVAKGLKQPNSEIVEQLRTVGVDRYGDEDAWVYPDDYDVDEGWVVYSIYVEGEPDRLVRVSFTRDDDTINLAEDDADVQRTVDYAPKSHKFSEHGKSVLADLTAFTARASEVVALRASKGKQLGDSADLLRQIAAQAKAIEDLLADPTTPEDDDAVQEYLRFVALTQGAMT